MMVTDSSKMLIMAVLGDIQTEIYFLQNLATTCPIFIDRSEILYLPPAHEIKCNSLQLLYCQTVYTFAQAKTQSKFYD